MTQISTIIAEYKRYYQIIHGALAQIDDNVFSHRDNDEDNSIALVLKHLGGNFKSRFTNFLTEDGEKEWRQRDGEFEEGANDNRAAIMQQFEEGYALLLETIQSLKEKDLQRTITIRQQELSVEEALMRSLPHFSFHAGEIVYMAKRAVGKDWQSLSIPKGQSATYNTRPSRERAKD